MVKSRMLLVLAAGLVCQGQNAPLGLFESHSDVGTVLTPGTVEYDAQKGSYLISGSGENMWAAADAFQFVWKKVSGDVVLSADITFPTTGGDAHKKAALIIRQNLDANSAYVDAALHGDGLTSLQTRDTAGAPTYEIQANVTAPRRLRIEKRGKYFFVSVAAEGEPLHPSGGSVQVAMQEPFYVGLAVCAHNKDAVERAVFTNVKLEKPVTTGLTLYSTLEIAPLPGDRRAIYVTPGRIESPSFSPDGTAILFQSNGKMQRIPAAGGKPEPVEDAPAAASAANVQVPEDDFRNLFPHPSPDGRRVVMLSCEKSVRGMPRDQDVLLRVMTVADKKINVIARITGGQGSMDSPSWSPDSRRVAYVTYQMLPK